MSDYTRTPNYNLYKPITGRDDDVWGDQICTNMDVIDGIMFANQGGTTAPTASPAYGRNGTNWLPVLPLVGGTMTGPLALAANASQPLQAVTLQQMQAAIGGGGAYLPLVGGVLTGPLGMNLTPPVDSDPSTIYTTYEAFANGGSQFWNCYWKAGAGPRVLTTGVTAWATVAGGSGYWSMSVAPSAATGATPAFKQGITVTAKGNVIVGDYLEPPNMSAATSIDGGVLKAWYTIANNYMSFMYYDGTNYRRLNGTLAPTQIISAGGSYMFQGAAVGAANSVVSALTNLATLDNAGNLTANGSIWAANRPGAFGLQDMGGGSVGLRFTSDNWKWWYWAPSSALYYTSGAGTNLFYIDGSGNTWAKGSFTGNYVLSTGDIHAQGSLWVDSGTMYVGNNVNYYLGRNGSNGSWYFVENGQVNFTVQTDGTCIGRGAFQSGWLRSTGSAQVDGTFACGTLVVWNNSYANGGVFCGGNGNTNFGFYPGSGQNIFQYVGNWYWSFATSGGDLYWYAGGARTWQMRQGGDWLSWNPTGTVGGNGGYYNISDRRVKSEIEPATAGLAEILQLEPVQYIRAKPKHGKRPDGKAFAEPAPTREIGFIAQDVATALPQAVQVILDGFEASPFIETKDDDSPLLALTYDTITAALVNAVKTLEARLAALEGTP